MEVERILLRETGHPGHDVRAFRDALGQFVTGIAVITGRQAAANVGVTVNSFSSVSLDPPLVSWSLRVESSSLEAFAGSNSFVVNILSQDQDDISSRFAKSGEGKFDSIDFSPGIDGIPILNGAKIFFECEKVHQYYIGDHITFIGRVVRFRSDKLDPLVFFGGRYVGVSDYRLPMRDASRPADADNESENMVVLLMHAFNRMLNAMSDVRKRSGFTINESRILNVFRSHPGARLPEVMHVTYMAQETAADTLLALSDRGLARVEDDGRVFLTDAGLAAINTLLSGVDEVERNLMKDIDPAKIAASREVIARICQ